MYKFKDYDSILELGGFANDVDEIVDEPYDEADNLTAEAIYDWEQYNIGLAEEYASALKNEDFYSLGCVDYSLLTKIIYWLNYNEEIAKSNEQIIDSISNGTLMTIKGRTIIDAIYEKHHANLADTYIDFGIHHPKLLLTCILCESNGYADKNDILDHLFCEVEGDKSRFANILNDLCNEIDIQLQTMENIEDKKLFLNDISDAINLSKALKKRNDIDVDFENYQFCKQLVKMKRETTKS